MIGRFCEETNLFYSQFGYKMLYDALGVECVAFPRLCSKSDPNQEDQLPHSPATADIAIGSRLQIGIDSVVLDRIENIVGQNPTLKRTGVSELHRS